MESHAEPVPQATHMSPDAVSEALVYLSVFPDSTSRMRLWRVLLRAQMWAAMVPNTDEGPAQWAAATAPGTSGPTCALFTSPSRLLAMFPDHRPTLVRFRGMAKVVAGAPTCRGILLDPGHPGAFEVSATDLGYMARGQIPPEPATADSQPPLGSSPEPPPPGLVRMVTPALHLALPMVPEITQAWIYISAVTGPPDETCVAVHMPEVSDPAHINEVLQRLVGLLVQTEELRCAILLLPTHGQLHQQLRDGGGLLAYTRPSELGTSG